LLISTIGNAISVFADSASTKQITKDQSEVAVRSIDQEKLNSFANDNDFNYNEEFEKPVNAWQQFLWWLNQQFQIYKALGYTWYYGKYVIMGIAILLIILQLLKVPIRGLFSSKPMHGNMPFQITEENLKEMDYDKLIEESIQKKLFRNAVRYLYLKTLNQLSAHDFIKWQQEKTNYDYLNEILNQELKTEFSYITQIFERIWYGEFPANEKIIEQLRPACKKMENIINAN
jgi:hypothetical protein